jgi:hypothetical protein
MFGQVYVGLRKKTLSPTYSITSSHPTPDNAVDTLLPVKLSGRFFHKENL